MALRKPEQTSAPAFEGMDDDETTVIEHETQAPAEKPATAKPSASTAVAAKPANTAVAASPLASGTAMKQLEWAIPASDLENLGIGVFPRITVDLGGFSVDKTVKALGSKIKLSIISWNPVWLVTTGEQNNKEADKLIRSSYDGINLKGGEGNVADYVKRLKEVEGYGKAGVKQYVEMYANLVWAEKGGDVPEDEQQIYQVSLPPTSVGQFQRYMLESALRRGKGKEDTNEVVVSQEKRVNGSNTYAIMIFTPK